MTRLCKERKSNIFFFLMIRRPPESPLFPYPTLFRSHAVTEPEPHRRPSGSQHDTGFAPLHVIDRRGEIDRRRERVPQFDVGLEPRRGQGALRPSARLDRKSTRLNSSHLVISYAVFCL